MKAYFPFSFYYVSTDDETRKSLADASKSTTVGADKIYSTVVISNIAEIDNSGKGAFDFYQFYNTKEIQNEDECKGK